MSKSERKSRPERILSSMVINKGTEKRAGEKRSASFLFFVTMSCLLCVYLPTFGRPALIVKLLPTDYDTPTILKPTVCNHAN